MQLINWAEDIESSERMTQTWDMKQYNWVLTDKITGLSLRSRVSLHSRCETVLNGDEQVSARGRMSAPRLLMFEVQMQIEQVSNSLFGVLDVFVELKFALMETKNRSEIHLKSYNA
jgi:hypothetical protein